jgi:hypothetical protein
MSFKKSFWGVAAVLVLPVLAQAQPVNGLYLGAGFGGNSFKVNYFFSVNN